jgi:ABC-type multidrug transport system fused ATPase/permease subunit
MKVFRKHIGATGKKHRTSHVGMTKSVNQALGGIKEVKILRREDYFQKRFLMFSNVFIYAITRFQTLNTVPKLLVESVCFGGAFIIMGLFILGGADISGLVPQLSLFVLAAFRLLPAVYRQVSLVNQLIFLKPAVEAVCKSMFDEDALYAAPINSSETAEDNSDITIRGLTFGYPRSNEPVLEEVSFIIPHRKSVAFVGSSGAGKTTLADLILGVLTPNKGGIYYEGKSIHHHFERWSGNVGYIPQQIYLLDETIRENVAFGIDSEVVDETKVWRALEQAQLKEFVKSLPNGLETIVGDRGIRLSGGQRQRIGIARAMYVDPPILVLDEATSSLDNDTEQAVMEAVMGFKGNKTMVIIAHRLSTIQHCDVVYRVENKNVLRER